MSTRSNYTHRVYCGGSAEVQVTIFEEKYLAGNGKCWLELETRKHDEFIFTSSVDCTPEKLREIAAMLIKSADEIDALKAIHAEQVAA